MKIFHLFFGYEDRFTLFFPHTKRRDDTRTNPFLTAYSVLDGVHLPRPEGVATAHAAPEARMLAMSSRSNPIQASTSSVCSPSSGARSTSTELSERWIGDAMVT